MQTHTGNCMHFRFRTCDRPLPLQAQLRFRTPASLAAVRGIIHSPAMRIHACVSGSAQLKSRCCAGTALFSRNGHSGCSVRRAIGTNRQIPPVPFKGQTWRICILPSVLPCLRRRKLPLSAGTCKFRTYANSILRQNSKKGERNFGDSPALQGLAGVNTSTARGTGAI